MTESKNPLLDLSDLIDYAAVKPEHVAEAVRFWRERLEAALARAPQQLKRRPPGKLSSSPLKMRCSTFPAPGVRWGTCSQS